jgi:hypothetical protein
MLIVSVACGSIGGALALMAMRRRPAAIHKT